MGYPNETGKTPKTEKGDPETGQRPPERDREYAGTHPSEQPTNNAQEVQNRTERGPTKPREVNAAHDKEKIEKLTESLRNTANDPSFTEEEIRITTVHLKKEIQLLYHETHNKNRMTLAAIDAAEGEKIGKVWSSRHKVSKPRDTVKQLLDPATNEMTRNSQRMAQIAAEYYKGMQHNDHDPHALPDEQTLDEILGPIRTKVTENTRHALASQITEEEVREAINKTTSEKAPGTDGIPIDLWKSLDDQFRSAKTEENANQKCDIVWTLTQVFRDIETHGVVEEAKFHEGCICPIYKKKDPSNAANYRPITLLNTDYKIFTKALSLKLANAAPEIINKDQAGFIKGRSIFDQVKTTKLVTDYMEKTNRIGAIVALDQEKAYDRILHPYLWAILEKFGIPEQFIKTVQALYDNAKTIVMINGELSNPFTVSRGVRQGDALSCLLFDIAIEPLAESIRRSTEITGIQIPGRRDHLKIKLFADDTTVYLSENDDIEKLECILTKWCRVSGAKFNIEKTEIIPLGNKTQRGEIIASRKLNPSCLEVPPHVHIAKDGEPVRILGAWLGNDINQAVTWAPILEDCRKRLKRWSAAKHSLEGRRLILQMQVAGVTQYLTKVQGMPKEVETDLNKQIRRFMWNNESMDTVNQAQMYATHKKGGKKVLDIEARNKAIHLTWLKAYLNLGEDRATWTYFADALIATDVPPSHGIDDSPESRIMPFIQSWGTRKKGSTLPNDLKEMLKLAEECRVQLAATKPTKEVQGQLPIWYHARSVPSARRLYKTKTAKCLRKKHQIRLVQDAMELIGEIPTNHTPTNSCRCEKCQSIRGNNKCTHPHDCLALTAELIKKIHPKWNPTVERNPARSPDPASRQPPEDEGIVFDPSNDTDKLKDAITIFGSTMSEPTGVTKTTPGNRDENSLETVVYTDGACTNNGEENACAGSGVWYGNEDPRNRSERVPLKEQSNQTGELIAILIAVRNQPPDIDLRIMSDSKYAIDGLTKNLRAWESRDWANVKHGGIFKCITAWMRWRNGKTTLQWVKGHTGIEGNEEADKLAKEGSTKQTRDENLALAHPTNQTTSGARLATLEQKDFYRILSGKRAIPVRRGATENIGTIQACTQESFGYAPTLESVWKATRHKDLTRKTRDFLWKSTQNAYKIGKYWEHIEGYEQRGTCPICNELEDMNHILTACRAKPRALAWKLANNLWNNKHNDALPTRLGDTLGCSLARFTKNGKPDKGKNRLYRIIVSETAYLVWKMRNERRIRDGDDTVSEASDSEVRNRWTHAINKRLTIDRALTNTEKFRKRAVDEKLVKKTWKGCLENEEDLPDNWHRMMGVLVGISRHPQGCNR